MRPTLKAVIGEQKKGQKPVTVVIGKTANHLKPALFPRAPNPPT